MSRYIVSYIRIKLDPTLSYEDSIWILSSFTLFLGLFVFVGGILLRNIGSRKTVILGSVICCSGVGLSYFTIKHSFILTAFTYGAMFGVGAGICYSVPLSCAMKWLPDNKGLVNGFVIAGIGGGALIFEPIQTAYINPENEIPDQQGYGKDKYFSQSDILDKIPSCFLMLGFCYSGIQLIGSLLLCDPQERINKELENPYSTVEPDSTSNLQQHHTRIKYNSIIEPENSRIKIETQNGCFESTNYSSENNANKTDFTPYEVLRSKFIYILWFISLFDGLITNFISTLYKAYGQTFIEDDHFLAMVGSLAAVCIGAGRIMWGTMSDRYSVRTCLMLSSGLMCIFMLTFNVTSVVGGKELYLIYVCLLFISLSGYCVLLATATAKTYGTEYYGENFGIVFSAIIISSPISAVLTSTLKSLVGWDGMFYLISGFSFIMMVLSWLFKVDRIS